MATPTAQRLAALRERLIQHDLDALLISCPENRRYISGFTARAEFPESCGMLLVSQEAAWLLTDFRYQEWAHKEAPDFAVQVYRGALGETLAEILGRLEVKRLGFEAAYLTCRQYQRLTEEIAAADREVAWQPTEGLVEALREIKTPEEMEVLRQALALSESVLQEVAGLLAPGLTERQVAWEIERRLRERGAEALAFPPIVAAGPNSAQPHHHPGDCRLKEGEPIIIDLGARVEGYCADLTRTYLLGPPDEQFVKIYRLVYRAQKRAEAELKAGLDSLRADALARDLIAAAGFGEAFGHSLGHGLGLAVHEAPNLTPFKERSSILQAGSLVTVEPGIYLPGWGGVRLEDMVLLHPDRAEVLNRLGFYEWVLGEDR